MTDYSTRMQRDIKKLLGDHGISVTFRRTATSGSYDPSTSTITAAAADDETVLATFTEFTEREFDGEIIKRGDRKVLLSDFQSDGTALSKVPRPNDRFVGERDEVRVVNVRRIKSGSNVIGYACQVRE